MRVGLEKALVLAATLACVICLPALARADGVPDPSFSNDGMAAYDLEAGTDGYPNDVIVDHQGRILVAGIGFVPSAYNYGFVIRLDPSGKLDPSFGEGGMMQLAGLVSDAKAIAVDSQDRVYVGGHQVGPGTSFDFAAARLLENGDLDPSYSGDGVQQLNFGGSSFDTVEDAALDAQGRFVLAGRTDQPGAAKVALARLTVDGEPDASFGRGDGMAIPDPTGTATGTADLALDRSGRILLSAYSSPVQPTHPLVMRLDANGRLDPSFNGSGQITIDFGRSQREDPRGLTVDPSDRPIIGASLGEDPYASGVARLTSSGALDQTFGSGGRFVVPFAESNRPEDLALDLVGRIVTVGDFTPDQGVRLAAVMRLASSGLDRSFGGDGLLTTNLLGDHPYGDAVTVDASGRYVIAGTSYDYTNARVGVARYQVTYPSCRGARANLIGTAGPDRLAGTPERDVIVGLGGNDVIKGLGGNDLICGGPGKDKLIGGPGRDVLDGGPGRDKLIGGPARDLCLAGPGGARFTGCERRR